MIDSIVDDIIIALNFRRITSTGSLLEGDTTSRLVWNNVYPCILVPFYCNESGLIHYIGKDSKPSLIKSRLDGSFTVAADQPRAMLHARHNISGVDFPYERIVKTEFPKRLSAKARKRIDLAVTEYNQRYGFSDNYPIFVCEE